MIETFHRIGFLVSPFAVSILLSSCIVPTYPVDGYHSSTQSSHGDYTTLPKNYVGNAYYNEGRYYSGGNFQTGKYNYRGRSYNNRYYYNGKYIYGGRYEKHESARPKNRLVQAYSRGMHRN